ncbi:MAG: ChbG/HpnK family deacetylase [candidate division KSB1 bacterium]|nr:ChbG/HpnK family deacetylase [candidate division KSB1 bacterium]
MKLIINADDLGFHSAVNAGICKAFTEGVLSSATLMANGAAFDEAVHQIKQMNLPTGIHFNLTSGIPVSRPRQIPTLVQETGTFWNKWKFAGRMLRNKISITDIQTELSSQIQKCLDAGIQLDHFDGHHHVHLLPPISRVVFSLMRPISGKYRSVSSPLHISWTLSPVSAFQQTAFKSLSYKKYATDFVTPDHFVGMELLNNPDKEKTIAALLTHLKPGITELMCHPGFYLFPTLFQFTTKDANTNSTSWPALRSKKCFIPIK